MADHSSASPIAWTIAGSDSGGGAGIQADLHTFQDLNIHGCSVITALTAQNSVGVELVESVSPAMLDAQLLALNSDLPAKAIKLGMQGDPLLIKHLETFLQNFDGAVVIDPVMIATSGARLLPQSTEKLLREKLLPHATIITPNLYEAEALLQRKIKTVDDVEAGAKDLLALGCESVLIKGGHQKHETLSQDYWTNGREHFWINGIRHHNQNTHGSGCTLSAALTACLAQGYDLKDALVISKAYVSQGIRLAKQVGSGAGPVAHLGWPSEAKDFPWITTSPDVDYAASPACTLPEESKSPCPLGLYPVVDSTAWVARLAKLGVKTLQLRIKSDSPTYENLKEEIAHSIETCRQMNVRLFINDHWALAIELGAYGVHIGQTDLDTADMSAIKQAGLRLGLSTHSYFEMARAHAFKPSYVACGPIYHTDSKQMPFAPQGLAQLKQWMPYLEYPWVAIGGIGIENFDDVRQTGVDGIAMISAITQAEDVESVVREFLG